MYDSSFLTPQPQPRVRTRGINRDIITRVLKPRSYEGNKESQKKSKCVIS